jgi:phytol kinase
MSYKDITGIALLFVYYAAAASSIALLSTLLKIPKEVIRKAYHIMSSLSVFLLLLGFENWYSAVIGLVALCIAAYLVLLVSQYIPILRVMTIGRKSSPKEVMGQSLYFHISLVGLIIVFWGLMGPESRYHAAIGIVAWGFGDASAAVFGRRFGRRKYSHPLFDSDKTLEGTYAMIAFSFVAIFATLSLMLTMPLIIRLLISFVLACVGAVAEAISRKGLDTLTVPFTVAFLSAFLALVVVGG